LREQREREREILSVCDERGSRETPERFEIARERGRESPDFSH